MPRYRYLAVVAACATLLAMPAAAAQAATARHVTAAPVLTTGKVGGTAVKKGAVLSTGLAKGSTLTLGIGAFTATCKSASLSGKVAKNPSSAGTATLSITAASISKCAIKGFSAPKISLTGLPYNATVSSGMGDPVTFSERKKSAPLGLKAVITVSGIGKLTCVFTAKSISGSFSNTGNSIAFASQKFALDKSASSADCALAGATTTTFSATYGPVVDTSVKHSPKVFVS